jgi:hypothetical protein
MAWMSVKVTEDFSGTTDRAVNTNSIARFGPRKTGGSRIWFADGSQIDVEDEYDEILNAVLTADAKKAKSQ